MPAESSANESNHHRAPQTRGREASLPPMPVRATPLLCPGSRADWVAYSRRIRSHARRVISYWLQIKSHQDPSGPKTPKT